MVRFRQTLWLTQLAHGQHGDAPAELPDVLLLLRGDGGGHAWPLPQLRDAGLDVLDVLCGLELHGDDGHVHVRGGHGGRHDQPGPSVCHQLPQLILPLPRKFLSLVHRYAALSVELRKNILWNTSALQCLKVICKELKCEWNKWISILLSKAFLVSIHRNVKFFLELGLNCTWIWRILIFALIFCCDESVCAKFHFHKICRLCSRTKRWKRIYVTLDPNWKVLPKNIYDLRTFWSYISLKFKVAVIRSIAGILM